MYKIKIENVKELKDGRNLRNISEKIGVTQQYLSNIFNGKLPCKRNIALCLISLKEQISIDDRRMYDFLNYYFEKNT